MREFNEYYKSCRCLVLHYVQNEYRNINGIFAIFLLPLIRNKIVKEEVVQYKNVLRCKWKHIIWKTRILEFKIKQVSNIEFFLQIFFLVIQTHNFNPTKIIVIYDIEIVYYIVKT